MSRGRRGNGRERFSRKPSGESDSPEEEVIVVTDESGAVIDGQDDEIQVVHAEKQPDPVVRGDEGDGDDPYEVLQRQFNEMKTAREAAEARNREYEQRTASHEQDQVATQRALLDHAFERAKSDVSANKILFREAMKAGNFDEAAEAQASIAAAQLDVRNYELAREEFERVAEQRAQKKPAQTHDPVEEYIGQFTAPVQNWARKHKSDLFSKPSRTQKAVALHYEAVDEGIAPDTDAYFAYLDKHMGYAETKDQPEPKKAQHQRPVMAAAPVSRSSNGVGGNMVELTAAERETAGRLGMSLTKYAKYKKELTEKGRDPNWRGPRYSQFDGQQKG